MAISSRKAGSGPQRRWVLWTIGAIVAVIVLASFASRDDSVLVTTATVSRSPIRSVISTNGKIETVNSFEAHDPSPATVNKVLLAEGDAFPNQAFQYGNAYGVQFHVDVTHAMMCRWTVRGHARMELPGAKQRHEHFADRPVYDHGIRAWLSDFLDHWLLVGRPRQLAAAE